MGYTSGMNDVNREKVRNRLKRVAGQVAGLQKMVEEDRYCVDILTQLAAVRSALDAVGVELLTDHVEHCVSGCVHHGHGDSSKAHPSAKAKSREELRDEVRLTLSRFLK
jgi:CsoR family transcriptional regulator, copper-sensing transcriptional repressor